ncbi:hypothetical protein LXA43DRAFT_1061703 [Ganoderma leucocontextum]|nr:hypothetical protein LXA43DRAFT_1061703 [Ganoderma leucocontextum]
MPQRAPISSRIPLTAGETTLPDTLSFATARSRGSSQADGGHTNTVASDGVDTVRPPTHNHIPHTTVHSPPSPSPRCDGYTSMLSMDQTSVVGAPFPAAGANFTAATEHPYSTPNVKYTQRWGVPQPAQSASQQASAAPRIPSSLSTHTGVAAPPTPRQVIATFEAALTSYQSSLQEQLTLRSQQLSEHASDLSSLHARSDAVLREYAGEVRAAQACTNRALQDNQQMLQDIERTIANSRCSLGLPPLGAVFSHDLVTSTIPPPVAHSAPPYRPSPGDTPRTDGVRAHTSPPMTEGVPQGTNYLAHDNNPRVPRLPHEPLDEYDQRIGCMARQQNRIVQAVQSSVDTLARSVRSLAMNGSNSHSSSDVPVPAPPRPATHQFSEVPDRYADYRSTYEAIVDEQHARARHELDQLRQKAAVLARIDAAGSMPAASVRFPADLPAQSVSKCAHGAYPPIRVQESGQIQSFGQNFEDRGP